MLGLISSQRTPRNRCSSFQQRGGTLRFSERHGYQPVRSAIQHESLDGPTRSEIWNLTLAVHKAETEHTTYSEHSELSVQIWTQLWRRNVDEIPYHPSLFQNAIKMTIIDGLWYEVLDLIEFVSENAGSLNRQLGQLYNTILEKNLCAYRFIGNQLVPIDSDLDLSAIEDALDAATPFIGAKHHLARAVEHLADRQSPDYANSVKESISAVESVCHKITGEKTLGRALVRLRTAGVEIHPALEKGWSNLYGYTSDDDGIRHFASDEPSVDQATAKYFLIACSAFVSLLISRSSQIDPISTEADKES
ncbi:AbiJ-NTD4 domain-containing protein [Kribbella sp. NPDC004875]|uniref:AbiJ-NTD4 domain-containing protein n=1 Tax=Kribbella sp. NPDC004875 TaxID=3364107 RepID=UPI003690169B